MANEDKIRILDEQPVLGDSGMLFVRTFAGPAAATKPKQGLANGTLYIKTDAGPGEVAFYDESTNKWSDEE